MGAKRSAKYLLTTNILGKIFTFIGSIFLARLLCPEDFGVLLMTSIVTGLVGMLGNMGFEYFYLQEHTNDSNHERNILNVTFKLRFLLNSILFLLQYFSSYAVEEYFSNPMVGDMLRIFAFNHIILVFAQINIFILRKKLDFRPESIGNLIGDASGVIMKVMLAWYGLGALSFAYGYLFGNVFKTVYIMRKQTFVPDIYYWDSDIFKRVYFFGKHSFVGGIAFYFSGQIEKIIMSSFFPEKLIGGYGFASGQIRSINSLVNKSLSGLIVSFIAKNKNKPQRLISILSDITYVQYAIMFPVYIILLFNIDTVIHYLFGEKWNFSVSLFLLFLIYSITALFYSTLSNLLTGLGYPDVNARLAVYQLIVAGIILLLTVLITPNIVIYVSVFILISLLFGIIKVYIGLQKIGFTFVEFLRYSSFKLSFLFIIISSVVLFVFKMTIDNVWVYFAFSVMWMLVWFYIFHLKYFRKQFLSALSTLVNKNSKMYQIISQL